MYLIALIMKFKLYLFFGNVPANVPDDLYAKTLVIKNITVYICSVVH